MKRAGRVVVLLIFFLMITGCVSSPQNPGVTVTNLDTGDIPQVPVGNFDVYTDSFLIENPTNATLENVGVDITLLPTAAYCHGATKSFTYPLLYSREKRTEQISIAEFGSLDCQYNYSYQVYSGGS